MCYNDEHNSDGKEQLLLDTDNEHATKNKNAKYFPFLYMEKFANLNYQIRFIIGKYT